MYCEKCGKEISNYSLMCRHCSSDISPDYEFLTAQAILKDKEALAALYTATYKSAYFVAYRMTKNEDSAVDILHVCYIKAFANLDTIAEPKKFDKWFNRIVANKCLDYLKRRKPMFLEDVYGEEFEEELPDDRYGNNPQIYSENEDINRIVRQIIEELPEEQRLCVLMYYYDEMSVREIAEELGVSENTVKSRQRLARNRIRTEVERLENKGYEFKYLVVGPFIMRCLKIMEKETPVRSLGFENIYRETANSVLNGAQTYQAAAPCGAGTYQAAKAAEGAVHSAVRTKIIIGLICGAAAVAGIAAAVHLINGEDDAEPTIADSSVSDTTTDMSAENPDMTSSVAGESEADVSSVAESVAESTGDSSETEPEPEPEEEGWREAYRELVNGYEDLDYHLYSGSALPDLLSYALYDIDQDDVPELIFLANDTGDYFRNKVCIIYSWNGSKAYEVSDLGLIMGDLGEFTDKKQFAVTEFNAFTGITTYYYLNVSDGELVLSKVGEADYETTESYEEERTYKVLPQITLIGSSYTGESLVPDDVTELIDDYVSEKPEKEEKPEKSESSGDLNKFIGMSKDELINDYFGGKYESGQIAAGQEYVLSYKNSSKQPHCEFGCHSDPDKIDIINVTEGGKLNDKIKIGMTYNELKEVCDFDMAYATFTTYDTSIDVTIDGEKWHIAFSLTDTDKAKLGLNNVTVDDAGVHKFDLSGINPKSTLGYYTEGR